MTSNQTDAVIELLRQKGAAGLTPIEALSEIGCFRLSARVAEAPPRLKAGEVIINVNPRNTYARYVLRQA